MFSSPQLQGAALRLLDSDPAQNLGDSASTQKKIRLLVVDDEPDVRTILVRYLTRLGHECAEAATGKEALRLVKSEPFDAVMSDIRMPEMSGMELLRRIKAYDSEIAVVMITANVETKDAVLAMKMGADDYILKPFVFDEVSLGLGRAIEKRRLKQQIRAYQTGLESMVVKRTSQLQVLFLNVIQSLIFALEAKDRYTDGHSRRVAWLSKQLGIAARLDARELEILQVGAIFHDLGKIGIREAVLSKTSSLTTPEYAHIRSHPEIGVRILQPLKEFTEIQPIVLHHHERFDGKGYPDGLKGTDIPFLPRLVAVADAFDAMTSPRPYREALSAPEALERLRRGAGQQFDPDLVGAFIPLACDTRILESLASAEWSSAGKALQQPAP